MTEAILAREMRPGDGTEVATLWQRYLPDTEDWAAWLPAAIDRLLAEERILGGAVFTQETVPRCVAAGISCFLSDDVFEAFVQDPRPYLNRRLLIRYRDGEGSVLLSPEDQASGNAGRGLNMFVLEYCQESFDFGDPWAHQILNAIIPVYIALHQGFNIRRSLHETELSVGHIQEAGGNPFQFEVAPQDPFSLSGKGHGPRGVYGVSRDTLSPDQATGIAKSVLFFQPPRYRLVPQEQRVIRRALEGLTDLEIARDLAVSRDRIRQIWRDIYAHLEDVTPDIFQTVAAPVEGLRRGGEKRRVTMAALRTHPQELRPNTLRRG